MKLNNIKLLVPMVLMLFFAVSCSDDDNGVTIPDPDMEEEMETDVVTEDSQNYIANTDQEDSNSESEK